MLPSLLIVYEHICTFVNVDTADLDSSSKQMTIHTHNTNILRNNGYYQFIHSKLRLYNDKTMYQEPLVIFQRCSKLK